MAEFFQLEALPRPPLVLGDLWPLVFHPFLQCSVAGNILLLSLEFCVGKLRLDPRSSTRYLGGNLFFDLGDFWPSVFQPLSCTPSLGIFCYSHLNFVSDDCGLIPVARSATFVISCALILVIFCLRFSSLETPHHCCLDTCVVQVGSCI